MSLLADPRNWTPRCFHWKLYISQVVIERSCNPSSWTSPIWWNAKLHFENSQVAVPLKLFPMKLSHWRFVEPTSCIGFKLSPEHRIAGSCPHEASYHFFWSQAPGCRKHFLHSISPILLDYSWLISIEFTCNRSSLSLFQQLGSGPCRSPALHLYKELSSP
jgi:hypothetical protein